MADLSHTVEKLGRRSFLKSASATAIAAATTAGTATRVSGQSECPSPRFGDISEEFVVNLNKEIEAVLEEGETISGLEFLNLLENIRATTTFGGEEIERAGLRFLRENLRISANPVTREETIENGVRNVLNIDSLTGVGVAADDGDHTWVIVTKIFK